MLVQVLDHKYVDMRLLYRLLVSLFGEGSFEIEVRGLQHDPGRRCSQTDDGVQRRKLTRPLSYKSPEN